MCVKRIIVGDPLCRMCRGTGVTPGMTGAGMGLVACDCASQLAPLDEEVRHGRRQLPMWAWVVVIALLVVVGGVWFYEALGNPAAWAGPGELAEQAGRWMQ